MEHAGHAPSLDRAAEDFGGIGLGLARVDDQRQAGLPRRLDMRLEALALRRRGRTCRNNNRARIRRSRSRADGRRLDQRRGAEVGMGVGLVRMNADAGPDIGLALGDGDDVAPFASAGWRC